MRDHGLLRCGAIKQENEMGSVVAIRCSKHCRHKRRHRGTLPHGGFVVWPGVGVVTAEAQLALERIAEEKDAIRDLILSRSPIL